MWNLLLAPVAERLDRSVSGSWLASGLHTERTATRSILCTLSRARRWVALSFTGKSISKWRAAT
jgi:hypothetical protein